MLRLRRLGLRTEIMRFSGKSPIQTSDTDCVRPLCLMRKRATQTGTVGTPPTLYLDEQVKQRMQRRLSPASVMAVPQGASRAGPSRCALAPRPCGRAAGGRYDRFSCREPRAFPYPHILGG